MSTRQTEAVYRLSRVCLRLWMAVGSHGQTGNSHERDATVHDTIAREQDWRDPRSPVSRARAELKVWDQRRYDCSTNSSTRPSPVMKAQRTVSGVCRADTARA